MLAHSTHPHTCSVASLIRELLHANAGLGAHLQLQLFLAGCFLSLSLRHMQVVP